MASKNIDGLDDLRAYIKRFPKTAQRGAFRGMQFGTRRVQRAARENLKPWAQGGGLDRGQLRQSITTFVQYIVNGVRGYVGTNQDYAPHVEYGTRPHWPPLGALAGWARRHNVDEFAIRLSISKHGTRARKFLSKATSKEIHNVIGDIVREVRAAIMRAK